MAIMRVPAWQHPPDPIAAWQAKPSNLGVYDFSWHPSNVLSLETRMNARVGFTTLFVQNKNLMHTSFVIEAYRTVERAHGQPPTKCFAFGSHLHVGHTEDVAKRLGIEVVTTSYGVKNAADYELVRVAGTLWPHLSDTIVVGSGDRGFLKWFRNLRAEGLRLECVARDHQICKEAQASYDALYRMDTKRMNLPTPTDLRQAVIDCIPQIEVGPVLMEDATGMLRASRIVPRNTPGHIFFDRYANVFNTTNGGRYVGLR